MKHSLFFCLLAAYSSIVSAQDIGSSCTSAGAWQCAGPFTNYYGDSIQQCQGRVNALWVDPDDSTILAGADGGGLWKSTNDGHSWHCITDGAGSSVVGMCGIQDIAVDPLNHNNIYISMSRDFQYTKSLGYSLGLAYSTDGGSTWNTDNDFAGIFGLSPVVTKIAYKPGTEQLYAISGLWLAVKSSPSASWGLLSAPGVPTWNDLEFSNITGDPILTASASGGTSGLWDYTGIGLTPWTDHEMTLPPGYVMDDGDGGADFTITSADTAYIRFYAHYGSGSSAPAVCLLMKTAINDGSLQMLDTIFPSALFQNDSDYYFQKFQVSQGNANVIYAVNYYVEGAFFQSVDQGHSFLPIFNGDPTNQTTDHVDGRCLFIRSSDSNPINDVVYFGCDGGVSKKRKGFAQTHSITGDSLTTNEFYSLDNTEKDEGIVVAGAQDNGNFSYLKKRVNHWYGDEDGDGFNTKMLQDNSNYYLSEVDKPYLLRATIFDTTVGAHDLHWPTYPSTEPSFAARPIYISPDDIEYIGYSHIFKKNPLDTLWTRVFLSDPIDDSLVLRSPSDFYIDNNNNNNVYIAYAGERVVSGTPDPLYPTEQVHLLQPSAEV